MADHGELIDTRTTAMNVAVASAHWTLARTEISADNIDQRFAKRRAPRLIANERGKNIAFLQKHSASGADRFLPATEINAACDQAAAIKTGELLLERARKQ